MRQLHLLILVLVLAVASLGVATAYLDRRPVPDVEPGPFVAARAGAYWSNLMLAQTSPETGRLSTAVFVGPWLIVEFWQEDVIAYDCEVLPCA